MPVAVENVPRAVARKGTGTKSLISALDTPSVRGGAIALLCERADHLVRLVVAGSAIRPLELCILALPGLIGAPGDVAKALYSAPADSSRGGVSSPGGGTPTPASGSASPVTGNPPTRRYVLNQARVSRQAAVAADST